MRVADTALDGLHRAEAKLERTADRLARLPSARELSAPEDYVDLSEEMVTLLEARQHFKLNTAVLKTALEMEDHLLDMLV